VDVADHEFATGSYLPPELSAPTPLSQPQTIISRPVHTTVCCQRPAGTLVVDDEVQESVGRSQRPPVVVSGRAVASCPPQMIICSVPLIPVKTAVWLLRALGADELLMLLQLP
jgi:hypothetical protein